MPFLYLLLPLPYFFIIFDFFFFIDYFAISLLLMLPLRYYITLRRLLIDYAP